ncbi:hypothetical protein [Thermococcus sp. JCM 11816]
MRARPEVMGSKLVVHLPDADIELDEGRLRSRPEIRRTPRRF